MLTGLVLVYLIVLMWFGFCGERHSSSGRAFLTSGGRAGALLCALSLVSTIIGGSATLGMGSLAQKIGSGAFWWLGVGAVGLLLHGWIAPKIRALPAVTLPEVVGVVAGRNAERWAGVIIAVSWIAVTAAQFVALHTLLLTLSSPLAAEVLYVMIAGVVIVHTITGGQSAVIRTDAFQAVLLLGGFTAAAFWLLGDRPDAVMALDPVPLGDRFGPWDLGRMMLLVGITYVVGPDMFSRTFTARDGQSARFAAWIASPCLVWFGVVVTGLALLNLQDPQPVAGWLSSASEMPAWLKGALALGLIAHMDTSPEASGAPAKWKVIDYAGGDICLNKEKDIVLSLDRFPEVGKYAGEKLVVTDGTTLLGADDKAGIAVLVETAKFFVDHPEIPHARLCFCVIRPCKCAHPRGDAAFVFHRFLLRCRLQASCCVSSAP